VWRFLISPVLLVQAAEASECVAELSGNDAFRSFANALYERGPIKSDDRALQDMLTLADGPGLDRNVFQDCVASSKYSARVTADLQEGPQIGINGAPGAIVFNNENGAVRPVSGAVPPESIAGSIEQVLN